ncbi:MAG TPA: GNAT family N-acetyltransferase [Candidatus Thermoplasmatota archaeon]|nr:GNAT family N-acetyltransferase [Candidatus Thermoplasmatota archaeon]
MLPTKVQTERLTLRRPRRRDAQAIFDAYGSDPEVARHLTWRTHASLSDTHQFLDQADRGWATGADNPYLAWQGDRLVGATGLTRVGPNRMRTGYLVARPLWGQGFADEMVRGMTRLAFDLRLCDIVEALVDPENERSVRVLRKAGFTADGEASAVHPNLGPSLRQVLRFVKLRQTLA